MKIKNMKIKHVLVSLFAILLIGLLIYAIIKRIQSYTLTNWAGNTSRTFDTMYTPTNMDELISVMKNLKPKTPIIIKGGSHSWSPTMYYIGTNATKKTHSPVCLNLINFKGNISFNSENSTVTCLSGTPMGELLCYLAENHRQTFETYPNSPYITIGGAVATCSHGASLSIGSISQLVTEMYYLLPGQDKCQQVPNELLGAYTSSLGQLGLVCTLTLKTIPISWFKQTNSMMPRRSFIQNMDNIVSRSDLLRVFWTPETNMCEVQMYNKLPNTTNDVISLYPCKIKNKFMVWQSQELLEGINYAPELDTQFGLSRPTMSLEGVTGYGQCQKQIECPKGIPSYAEEEFGVPIENLDTALDVIKEWIIKYNPVRVGGIFLRFTQSDTLPWISCISGAKSSIYVWIIVDLNLNYPEYFSQLDILGKEMWTKAGARPHMGKWNNIDEKTFIEMYGKKGVQFLELSKNIQ
jgi:hypothetical protein